MELKTTAFSAVFDSRLNNFSVIKNLFTGDNYIKTLPHGPIISLYAMEEAKKIELLPGVPFIWQEENTLHIRYEEFGGRPVEVDLTVWAEDNKLIFSAFIDNKDTSEIVETLYPRVGGIYLGKDYTDDIIIFPHHAGERTVNPVNRYGCGRKKFWRAASVPYEDYFRREINYCGLASMSWMYYYDKENGLYIGSHDPLFPVTGVIAETSGNPEKPWMGFAFRKYHRIRMGEQYHTGDYVIAVSCGDWHYGASLYRGYITPYLDVNNNPGFLSDEYALNQCYNFKRIEKIENRFEDIPKLYEAGKSWGIRHIFIASWNRSGFDSFYPEYYPDMELGSAMEFRRGLEYIRKNGGFSTLYINARIFDLKSDFHFTVGQKMAIRDESGNMIEEVYGPAHFTVNCPSDNLWRDYLIDTAEFAMKAYGCDGIYLDQLASAEPFSCYSTEHSHDNTGEFNNGYVNILKELLKRLREYNENAYLMTENCGDIYAGFVWGNLTWNGAPYDEFYNVFKYTFPEFVHLNMVNPRSWETDEKQRILWFYKDMHRAILLGSVLWMGITTRLKKESGEYHTYAKKALAFRRHLQPLIKQARFLDDLMISDISDGCDATCWKLEDGRSMVLAGNPQPDGNGMVKLVVPESTKQILCFDFNWQSVILNSENGLLRHELDSNSLFCILFDHTPQKKE